MPGSLLERLQRLEASVRRAQRPADGLAEAVLASSAAGRGEEPAAPRKDPGTALASLGFVREYNEVGAYWVRRLRYDLFTRHGCVRLGDVCETTWERVWQASVRRAEWTDADAAARRVQDLRFYDTESTGLGTGAGTFPFLHGIGRLEEDELVVEQFFVAEYADEPAVLAEVRRRFEWPGCTVVSFNGKSFDWPLLLSRLAMYRMPAPASPAHIDLLHPARRLWQRRIGKVSLAHLELHVLGLARVDDLPGKEAPARYFEFLESQDAGRMEPVLEHNAADVCSLAALLAVVAQVLAGVRPPEDAYGHAAVGRWYDEWQEYDIADRCFANAIRCPDADWRVQWLASLHFKRRGQWEAACGIWTQMSQAYPWSVAPLVELAKYAEHRAHCPEDARRWVKEALQRATLHRDAAVIAQLRHRLARIERKLARSGES